MTSAGEAGPRGIAGDLFAPADRRRAPTVTPLWWRLPTWAAITLVTVLAAHGVWHRVLAGVLMGIGSLALQVIQHPNPAVRRASLVITTVTGLGACYASRSGIAEILVLVVVSRAALALDGLALRWFTVLDTIAFGVTVAVISNSWYGLLAGVGIPLLVQRAVEQRELIRERDRVKALLVEAQAGREAEAQAAALQERGRIAREMHDVLAHSLAGLSVQLQAVRTIAAREGVPAVVLDPLDKAAALAREGLLEARAAVGTLRNPVGLGIDALPALVERHPGRAALSASGPARPVSADVGHAVYRAVQESLTNAARYAPGGSVAVQLAWHDAALDISIDDTGRAPGRDPLGGQSTGLGLAGMGERLAQVGGSLTAGPSAAGGWRVHLTVPVERKSP